MRARPCGRRRSTSMASAGDWAASCSSSWTRGAASRRVRGAGPVTSAAATIPGPVHRPTPATAGRLHRTARSLRATALYVLARPDLSTGQELALDGAGVARWASGWCGATRPPPA